MKPNDEIPDDLRDAYRRDLHRMLDLVINRIMDVPAGPGALLQMLMGLDVLAQGMMEKREKTK